MKINVKIPKKLNIGKIKTGTVVLQSGNGASYGIGDVYITSTNENPSLRLGGTWELIDKHFKEWSYYSVDLADIAQYVTPHTNATPYAFGIVRSEHSVYIRYYFENNVLLSDDSVTVGYLNFSKFGMIDELYLGIYGISAGSEEGIALMNVSASKGEISVTDVVVRGYNTSIPRKTGIRFEFESRVPKEYMLDEACDKFFWKKVG